MRLIDYVGQPAGLLKEYTLELIATWPAVFHVLSKLNDIQSSTRNFQNQYNELWTGAKLGSCYFGQALENKEIAFSQNQIILTCLKKGNKLHDSNII